MKTRRLRIRERKLGREQRIGLYWWERKLVELDPRQTAKERLDTLIHELLHHLNPDFSEEAVIHHAKVLSRHVWRDGYRRVEGISAISGKKKS